jgi:N-acyl-D-amino-acid deacylase
MDFKVMQGVTTDVVGNCGLGAAPYTVALHSFAGLHTGIQLPPWEGYAGYFDAVERDPPSLNIAALAGHGTIREAAMGNQQRAPDAAELAVMRRYLDEAVNAGVVGFSTGLIYEPGRYAATDEIIDLARRIIGSGAIYTSHMRNEADRLLDLIRETIRIGAEARVPVQISHHKASGRENWGKVNESLHLIEQARSSGLDVTADQYPYTSGSTILAAVLQNDALNERGRSGAESASSRRIRCCSHQLHAIRTMRVKRWSSWRRHSACRPKLQPPALSPRRATGLWSCSKQWTSATCAP